MVKNDYNYDTYDYDTYYDYDYDVIVLLIHQRAHSSSLRCQWSVGISRYPLVILELF